MESKDYRWPLLFISIYLAVMLLRQEQQENSNLDMTVFQMQNQTCAGIMTGDSSNSSVANDQEREAAANLLKFIESSYPSFGIKAAAEKSDFNQLIMGAAQVTIPWIIVFLIALFGYSSCVCSCVCDCCCPPKCCKCCHQDENVPYTSAQLNIPMVFLTIFCLLIIAVAIPGIVYGAGVSDGLKSMRCAFFAAVGDLVLNKNGTIWPGMEDLYNRLSLLAKDMDSFTNSTEATFVLNQHDYEDDFSNLMNENKKLIDTINPDSYYMKKGAIEYLCCNQPISDADIQDQMILANIFPQSDFFTDFYTTMIASLEALNTAGEAIGNNTGLFSAQILNGTSDLNTSLTKFTDLSNQFYTASDGLNTASSRLTLGSVILYAFALFLGSIAIIGVLLLGLFKFEWSRYLIHCAWCSYGIIMILGFIIVIVLFPLNGVMAETCIYIDGMITVRSEMAAQNLVKDKQKAILLECLFDQGDILKTFNMSDQINQIRNLSDQLKLFQATSAEYDTAMDEGKTIIEKWNLKFTQDFTTIERVDDATRDPKNPDAKNINDIMFTFSDGSADGCPKDTYLATPFADQCPSGTAFNDKKPFPSPESPQCLGGVFLQQAQQVQGAARYAACASQLATYNQLQAKLGVQVAQWNPVFKEEGQIVTIHNTNSEKLQDRNRVIDAYAQNVSSFLNNVVDPDRGLVNGINCTFLKATVGRFYDSVCVNLVPSLWKTELLLALMCTAMLLGACTGQVTALRHHHNWRINNKGTKRKEQETEMVADTTKGQRYLVQPDQADQADHNQVHYEEQPLQRPEQGQYQPQQQQPQSNPPEVNQEGYAYPPASQYQHHVQQQNDQL